MWRNKGDSVSGLWVIRRKKNGYLMDDDEKHQNAKATNSTL